MALAHDGVRHVKPGKLDLPGFSGQEVLGVLHHPVVQGAVNLIFQRAEGMGDFLHGVADGMGEIIHGVDAPLVPGAPVFLVLDAVHGRIPHDEVGGGHVDLHTQGFASFREFAGPHASEQVQAFLRRTVPPGAVFARFRQRPAVGAHLLSGQLVHIGQSAPNPVLGDFIAFIIIVGGVKKPARPVKAQPVNILFNVEDVFHILLGGVGVVKAQVALAAEFFRRQEVHDQRLAVTDVHITVGLGREAGVYGRVPALRQVLFNGVPYEIGGFTRVFHSVLSFT